MALSFPPNPYLHQVVDRHDLNFLCRWNGTHWITTGEYNTSTAITTSGSTSAAFHPLRQDFAPYITRISIDYVIGTLNNTSNQYSITVRSVNAGYSAATVLRAISTGNGGLAWNQSDAAVNLAPANRARFDLEITKSGAPGTLVTLITVYYRLIIA